MKHRPYELESPKQLGYGSGRQGPLSRCSPFTQTDKSQVSVAVDLPRSVGLRASGLGLLVNQLSPCRIEKHQVRSATRFALDHQGQFARVIISPH